MTGWTGLPRLWESYHDIRSEGRDTNAGPHEHIAFVIRTNGISLLLSAHTRVRVATQHTRNTWNTRYACVNTRTHAVFQTDTRRVVRRGTDVSEEHIPSILSVKKQSQSRNHKQQAVSSAYYYSTLKTEAIGYSETSGSLRITRRYNPTERTLHSHSHTITSNPKLTNVCHISGRLVFVKKTQRFGSWFCFRHHVKVWDLVCWISYMDVLSI
jgi:hypothetical protein